MNLTNYSSSESSNDSANSSNDESAEDYFNMKILKKIKPKCVISTTTTTVTQPSSINSFLMANNTNHISSTNTSSNSCSWSFGLNDSTAATVINSPNYYENIYPLHKEFYSIFSSNSCYNTTSNFNAKSRMYNSKIVECHSNNDGPVCKYVSPKRRKTSDNCSQPENASNNQQTVPQPQIKYLVNNVIRTNLKKKRNNHVPKKLYLHLQNHHKPVNRIKWCCDEFSNLILTASLDNTIKVSDIFQKRCVYTIRNHTAGVRDATWTSCGKKIGSCGYDKMLTLTDLEAGKDIYCYTHIEFLTSIQFQPSNDNVVVLGSNNTLLSFDTRLPVKPVKIFKYKDLLDQVLDICFLNDQEFVSSCSFVCRESADRCLMVWDLSTASVISNQIFHEKYTCPRIRKHPHRNEFVAQTNGNYIAQFQSEPPYRMNKHKQFNGHKVLGYDVGCDINPNGGILISGSTDGRVVFYDYTSTKLLTSLITTAATTENDDNVVLDVSWHPVLNGMCACSTWSGGLFVWN